MIQSLKEWQSNPDLANLLRVELQKPIWIEALNVLESMSYTRKFSGMLAPAIEATGTALAGQMIGYALAQENLRLLTLSPADAQTVLRQTYGVPDNLERPTE